MHSRTPLEKYQLDLASEGFSRDPAQEAAVMHLQALYDALIAAGDAASSSKVSVLNFFGRSRKKGEPVRGLYFWGGVGRGKTYLVDTFYECLPFEKKMRTHFHRFMRHVHEDLQQLKGEKNPLDIVARRIAEQARVLCFDEFFVSDITDAMILAGLLEGLFENGVTLVATSNIEPGGLYENGLQRARFLPAIDLLEKYTQVVNVDGGVDYRLRALERAEIFHAPLDSAADESLMKSFEQLAPEPGQQGVEIEVEKRTIPSRWCADDVVWFDFPALCDGPRSQNDYIEIARCYHAVLVSNVPQMGADQDDQARRFINMVDEFYDRNVKLILSAAVPIDQLYTDTQLAFVFERTQSRLLEMQSHEYLARQHKA